MLARPSSSASAVPGQVLGDLARIWELRSETVGVGALRALSRLVSRYPDPPWDHEVIPPGADLSRLLECPFRARAMNCIRMAVKSGRLTPDMAVTVEDLLDLPNLGRRTLLEVMCVAEAATDNGFLASTCSTRTPKLRGYADRRTRPPPSVDPDRLLVGKASVIAVDSSTHAVSVPRGGQLSAGPLGLSSLHAAPAERSNDAWESAILLLKRLLVVSIEFHGARTLSDALTSDLGKLMTTLSMTAAFDRVPIADLAMGRTMAEECLLAFTEFWQSLSPGEQMIFEHRVVVPKSLTLEDLGSRLNLTRERVRQIQNLVKSKWKHPATETRWWLGAIAAIVHQSAGPVTAESELEDRISAFLPGGQGHSTASVARLARQLLRKELSYRCLDGVCLDAAAFAVVENLKAAARSIADDAGLIDEQKLRAHLLDETWWPHWETLVGQCGVQRLSGRLALRDTKKARSKAALLLIGRPATKEELGEIGGVAPARVGSYLSAMAGVVRADKKRWGLAEWVEDEYEGIPAEIVQRIEEDGGATRLERLVEELPRLFGVSENSVRAYCNAAMFVADDEWIRLRGDREPYSYKNPDVACAPGVFALGDRRVGLLYEVDHDVLRGSGRHLPHAAAAILRVRVNDRLRFVGPGNTAVTVTFPGTAHQGPSLGSSRALAEAASATCGDMMALVLDAGEMAVSVTVTGINEYKPGWALIARLTGINEQSGIEGLAAALKCGAGEVRATLRSRGDLVVLGAMPPRRFSPDLDDALAKLEAEANRGAAL